MSIAVGTEGPVRAGALGTLLDGAGAPGPLSRLSDGAHRAARHARAERRGALWWCASSPKQPWGRPTHPPASRRSGLTRQSRHELDVYGKRGPRARLGKGIPCAGRRRKRVHRLHRGGMVLWRSGIVTLFCRRRSPSKPTTCGWCQERSVVPRGHVFLQRLHEVSASRARSNISVELRRGGHGSSSQDRARSHRTDELRGRRARISRQNAGGRFPSPRRQDTASRSSRCWARSVASLSTIPRALEEGGRFRGRGRCARAGPG